MQSRKSKEPGEPGGKAGRKAGPRPDAKAEAKADGKASPKSDAKASPKAGAKADAKTSLKTDKTAADAQSAVEPDAAPTSDADVAADAAAASADSGEPSGPAAPLAAAPAAPEAPADSSADRGAAGAGAPAVVGRGASTALRQTASATEESNRMVWRGQSGHYEVWPLTVYHPATRTAYWLRYTLESPDPVHGAPYVELWFCRCDAADPRRNFGIHRRFPLASFESSQAPFRLRIADSELGHDRAHGSLSGNSHEVSWDLRWEPAARLHLLLPSSLYGDRIGIAETLLLSPNHSIEISGSIEIDGERIELAQARGGQSHLWGRKHAYGWGWGRCNAFELVDEHPLAAPASAVLETLSVRMRRGPVVIPLTVVSVYPDGLVGPEIAFKQWMTMPLCRADFRTGTYTVTAQGPTCKVEAQYSCRPDDMIRTEYVDPDGSPAYNHFAGAASCRLTLSRRTLPGTRWKPFRTFRTEHGAQFEWAGRAGDSQVKNRHVRIDG